MKKVTLLGDSIRLIGYGQTVEENLKKDFIVWQPDDNCRFAQYTLRGLWEWAPYIEGSDIIHWNNGHWDLCELYGDGTFTDIEDYVKIMSRLADLLLKRCKKLIFATTTPIIEGYPYNRNSVVNEFNAAVVPVLQAKGVIINDLHTLLKDEVNKYIGEDMLHLTEDGIAVCVAQVEKVIREVAAEL